MILMDNSKLLFASGAYGREYSDLADVLIDWFDGKDFQVISGPYFSCRDADVLRNDGYKYVKVDGWIIPLS